MGTASTEEYRESFPYRTAYFRWNPGIFGFMWFCSQCHKPLFGKSNVIIDHIVPLNKGGLNAICNCTSCCRACNSSKSDKGVHDGREGAIYYKRGKSYRRFEILTAAINRTRLSFFSLPLTLIYFAPSVVSRKIDGSDKYMRQVNARRRISTRRRHWIGSNVFTQVAASIIYSVVALTAGVAKVLSLPLRRGNWSCRVVYAAIYFMVCFNFIVSHTNLLDRFLW